MRRPNLMKLNITAFRGVRDPFSIEFNTKNSLSIIYGENGSGKTTLSDALEFVFHGNSGSLEEKSLDGKGKISALVHAQCDKEDLSVTWTDHTDTLTAKIDKTKADISGSTKTKLHSLSRKNITALIEATPAKRFSSIQEFVSLPAVEAEEHSLKTFIKEQKQLQQSELNATAKHEADLETLHLQTNSALTRPQWIRETLEDSEETIKENKILLSALNHEIIHLRDGFKPLLQAYSGVATAIESLRNEQTKLATIVATSTNDFTEALATLQSAHTLFETTTTDTCPVCDTPFSHQELQEKVTSKLSQLSSLTAQSNVTKAAESTLTSAQTILTTQQSNYYSIITKLSAEHAVASENDQWQIPPLIPQLLTATSAEKLTQQWFSVLKTHAADLKPLSQYVETTLAQLEAKLHIQNQLKAILTQQESTQKDHSTFTTVITKAEGIAELLRRARIDYINNTLADISNDFARLYSKLHEGEDIEQIKLYLHPSKNASAQFDGTLFGNENMSPVACLSESHLDTLGLCLFLALQKIEAPENAIIYLDDAIASVDEAHMERLYHLILDESQHFKHVIISSHYQPLRFKFRWGILTQKQVNFIELGKWSIEHGIALTSGPKSEISLLRAYLVTADDPSTIAGKSGIILEQIFDFLTGIYQCSMPRSLGSEQRWTLADYFSGIKRNNKLYEALRCDHLNTSAQIEVSHSLPTLIDKIEKLLQFRNALGCHYKELAGQFDQLSEATKLANATLLLVAALCDEHDELPTSNKDGISWKNCGKNVTRRLYPIQAPK